jgi:hypothetical protein
MRTQLHGVCINLLMFSPSPVSEVELAMVLLDSSVRCSRPN